MEDHLLKESTGSKEAARSIYGTGRGRTPLGLTRRDCERYAVVRRAALSSRFHSKERSRDSTWMGGRPACPYQHATRSHTALGKSAKRTLGAVIKTSLSPVFIVLSEYLNQR